MIKKIIYSALILTAVLAYAPIHSSVSAEKANIAGSACTGIKSATDNSNCKTDDTNGISKIIKAVIGFLSIAVGAASVIMIIVGGFKYITSNGDSNSTKSAKDTIMYALIGLALVLMAQVIVRFVYSNV